MKIINYKKSFMMITIIKVALLLCFLIIPLKGPSKRRDDNHKRPDKSFTCSKYGINALGELEEIFIEEKDGEGSS